MTILKAKYDITDLPPDSPLAPWNKGETREVMDMMAAVLMHERTDAFEVVEPKGAKAAKAPVPAEAEKE